MTQNERVLDYMQRFGSITQLEALSDLGIQFARYSLEAQK